MLRQTRGLPQRKLPLTANPCCVLLLGKLALVLHARTPIEGRAELAPSSVLKQAL